MKLANFDYVLPEQLIADRPSEKRENSRLLLLNKKTGKTAHHQFYEMVKFLKKGDILVVNNSKVFPARLIGKKETGGAVELLLNHQVDNLWEAMGKRVKDGQKIFFNNSALEALVVKKDAEIVQIKFNLSGNDLFRELERIGSVPIPPYIEAKRKKENSSYNFDKERYQTVYAKEIGSSAAPTAGLHFSNKLIAEIEQLGVEILEVTLHVGLGTFASVTVKDITKHEIHEEFFTINQETYNKIKSAKAEKRRIISVGTTATRVLETVFSQDQNDVNLVGWTKIYIYPGYKFKCIDGMITNFHLPKSSLLFLVSALAGRGNILKAYQEAILSKYRFYSYGDAMLII